MESDRWRSELYRTSKLVDRFLRLNQTITKADAIIVMGNNDDRTATRASRLFSQRLAPIMVLTGGIAPRTRQKNQSEARRYLDIIRDQLPYMVDDILLEEQAQNSGENSVYSRQLLESYGIYPENIVIVTKPFVERRALATFIKQWSGPRFFVTSPQYPFDSYLVQDSLPLIARSISSEVDRIQIYQDPDHSFITPQIIPENINEASCHINWLLSHQPPSTILLHSSN